jgi:hypothetical protein
MNWWLRFALWFVICFIIAAYSFDGDKKVLGMLVLAALLLRS